MRLFIDIDEVLADFVGGACKAHGVPLELMRAHQVPGTWDISKALRHAKNVPAHKWDMDAFWQPMRTTEFWQSLNWTEHGKQLLEYIKPRFGNNWWLLSAPNHCHTSYNGKVAWIKAEFGATFDRFILTPHKELLAQPGTILIDDRPANLDKWTKAGGTSILYPNYGNCLYKQTNPAEFIKGVLDALGIPQHQ